MKSTLFCCILASSVCAMEQSEILLGVRCSPELPRPEGTLVYLQDGDVLAAKVLEEVIKMEPSYVWKLESADEREARYSQEFSPGECNDIIKRSVAEFIEQLSAYTPEDRLLLFTRYVQLQETLPKRENEIIVFMMERTIGKTPQELQEEELASEPSSGLVCVAGSTVQKLKRKKKVNKPLLIGGVVFGAYLFAQYLERKRQEELFFKETLASSVEVDQIPYIIREDIRALNNVLKATQKSKEFVTMTNVGVRMVGRAQALSWVTKLLTVDIQTLTRGKLSLARCREIIGHLRLYKEILEEGTYGKRKPSKIFREEKTESSPIISEYAPESDSEEGLAEL